MEKGSHRLPPWGCWCAEPEFTPMCHTLAMPIRALCQSALTGHACFLDAKDGLIPSPFIGDKLLTMTINHKIKSLKNRHTQ